MVLLFFYYGLKFGILPNQLADLTESQSAADPVGNGQDDPYSQEVEEQSHRRWKEVP